MFSKLTSIRKRKLKKQGVKMKNAVLCLLVITSSALITGCGRSDANWYPFDRGRINLSKISRVVTEMSITIVWKETKDMQHLGEERQQKFEGPITEESINSIKKCIHEHEKDITGYRECAASLKLDLFEIRLPTLTKGEFQSARDLELMVCNWLIAAEDLFSRL